ncbi:hypothetical protein SLS61_001161 [Didymella pomorum]
MKWTLSCRNSKARFTFECKLSSEYIYRLVLGLPKDHSKKIFKIPVDDFTDRVGCPVGKVRVANLYITGTDVNVRWEPEKSMNKVSGTYGKE